MKRELTNQELLDRYICAVKMMLPPDKVEDIAAEIRSNLESLAEDRAAELGRELSVAEMSAILKQRGHPSLVAIPYRDPNSRSLIGPRLFPFYWFTLRAALAVWVTIRLIVAIFVFQGATSAGEILWKLGRDILVAAVVIPTSITWLFALWEYLEFKFRFSERWKPESLPAVPSTPRPPSPRPAWQILSGVVWLIFWGAALFVPELSWPRESRAEEQRRTSGGADEEHVLGGQLHRASWCRVRQEENRRFGSQPGAVPKPWFSAQSTCQKSASCILPGFEILLLSYNQSSESIRQEQRFRPVTKKLDVR
jgi:hypothetical protein